MLNQSQTKPVVGDYDPESPRPNGVTGTMGPSSVVPAGTSSASATFVPPPAPPLCMPGAAFGATLAMQRGQGFSPGAEKPVAPLFPPSRIPNLGKPPRTFSGSYSHESVSRSASIQSDPPGSRVSLDAHGSGGQMAPPVSWGASMAQMPAPPQNQMPAATVTHPSMESNFSQQGDRSHSSYQGDLDLSSHSWQPEATPTKPHGKPPPAVAKESPLRAMYAKGAGGYVGSRSRVSLNASLNSVAGDDKHEDRGTLSQHQISADHSSVHTNFTAPTTFGDTLPKPFVPSFHPEKPGDEQIGSSKVGSMHQIEQEGTVPGVFQPSKPTKDASGVAPETSPALASKRKDIRGVRKRQRIFLRKRTVATQMIFLLSLLLYPSQTILFLAQSGGAVLSALNGFDLKTTEEFKASLLSTYGDQLNKINSHRFMDTVYHIGFKSSSRAWDITHSKLACDKESIVCKWSGRLMHSAITSGFFCIESFQRIVKESPMTWKTVIRPALFQILASQKAVLMNLRATTVDDMKSHGYLVARKLLENSKSTFLCSKNFLFCCIQAPGKFASLSSGFGEIMACLTTNFDQFLQPIQKNSDSVESPMQELESNVQEIEPNEDEPALDNEVDESTRKDPYEDLYKAAAEFELDDVLTDERLDLEDSSTWDADRSSPVEDVYGYHRPTENEVDDASNHDFEPDHSNTDTHGEVNSKEEEVAVHPEMGSDEDAEMLLERIEQLKNDQDTNLPPEDVVENADVPTVDTQDYESSKNHEEEISAEQPILPDLDATNNVNEHAVENPSEHDQETMDAHITSNGSTSKNFDPERTEDDFDKQLNSLKQALAEDSSGLATSEDREVEAKLEQSESPFRVEGEKDNKIVDFEMNGSNEPKKEGSKMASEETGDSATKSTPIHSEQPPTNQVLLNANSMFKKTTLLTQSYLHQSYENLQRCGDSVASFLAQNAGHIATTVGGALLATLIFAIKGMYTSASSAAPTSLRTPPAIISMRRSFDNEGEELETVFRSARSSLRPTAQVLDAPEQKPLSRGRRTKATTRPTEQKEQEEVPTRARRSSRTSSRGRTRSKSATRTKTSRSSRAKS